MHPHLFEPQLSTPSTVVTVQLGYLIIPHNRLFSNEFKIFKMLPKFFPVKYR